MFSRLTYESCQLKHTNLNTHAHTHTHMISLDFIVARLAHESRRLKHTRTHKHTHTHAHTHTNTHKHTHTHTHLISPDFVFARLAHKSCRHIHYAAHGTHFAPRLTAHEAMCMYIRICHACDIYVWTCGYPRVLVQPMGHVSRLD